MADLNYLRQQLEAEAEACAAAKKSQGLKGFFTRKDRFYQECKNSLMQGKYKPLLDEANAQQQYEDSLLNDAYLGATGLSKQTLMILGIAGATLLTIILIFSINKN